MEIVTDEMIEQMVAVVVARTNGNGGEIIKIIKDQALEIRELQQTICRLRAENQKQYEENQKC